MQRQDLHKCFHQRAGALHGNMRCSLGDTAIRFLAGSCVTAFSGHNQLLKLIAVLVPALIAGTSTTASNDYKLLPVRFLTFVFNKYSRKVFRAAWRVGRVRGG